MEGWGLGEDHGHLLGFSIVATNLKGAKIAVVPYTLRGMPKQKMARVLMWVVSSSLANFLFALSNIVLIAGAAAVLVGTIGSIKMGAIREQFANERISANEAATSAANARAADANARAAELELKVAEAKN